MKILLLATLFLLFTNLSFADTEQVYVQKVTDDNAIIVRNNGETYLIEKGVGCLSLWRYEGKSIIINSPGMFLGAGSAILLTDSSQQCRIWDSKLIGQNDSTNKPNNTSCSPEAWITEKSGDGSIIVLSDGTTWEIDSIDRIYSGIWLPAQRIVVCNDQLLNLDNNDKASARKIK